VIALNGRFLSQGLTGVQRYAQEVARALDAMAGRPPIRLLAPPDARGLDAFPRLAPQVVGRRTGQAWEQLDLPRALRGGEVLVGLGNTGPLLGGGRQVVVIHDAGAFDTPESYGRAFRLWYRAMQRGLVWRSARIVTVSRFSAARIGAALGLDASSIPVTLEGAEHILRAPADGAILAAHGLEPARYALAVGTGAAHKNLGALRGAAEALALHGMALAVVGAKDARVFAAGADAPPPGVRALGRVPDAALRALYENALCLLFPSRYEGFGLPPVEAMRCLCPVVAARAGAVEEVCGDAALWVAEGECMGAAALNLLAEPGLRARLVAAGRARADALTWEAAARRLLAACE